MKKLRKISDEFMILDSLAGYVSGDYEEDLKRANQLGFTFTMKDYQRAHNISENA